MSAPLVLLNGNIITMDPQDTRAEAVAFDKQRIVRVGSNKDMDSLIENGWPSLDLAGKTLLPGFIDTHQHTMLTGLMATAVPLNDVADVAEIVERLRNAVVQAEKGEWVRGSYLNEQNLVEKRMPSRTELDQASTQHPIYVLHATAHMCSFNSCALEILKIPRDLEGCDHEGGEPTGVVRDPGILTFVHPALSRVIPAETKVSALKKAARMALKKGITTLHCLDGGDLGPGDTKFILSHRDQLPVRVVCYNQSMDLNQVREMGLPRVGGCICADGAFEAHTAALFEPYTDDPENYGTLTYTQETMDAFILEAHREGLQIAVHCESERSIEQVLWGIEKAIKDTPRADHRHRIEHLELPSSNQLDRMAKAGIMAAMQPAFIPAFIGQEAMEMYERLLGKARLRRVHPYRTILDKRIPIAGGSDSPVTPYDPLLGIQAAINHPNQEERVTLREALEMFTSVAAWSAFEEKEKGTIETGKLADLVVLSADPYNVKPRETANIQIEAVFVGGSMNS